jgi:hypothetical protein
MTGKVSDTSQKRADSIAFAAIASSSRVSAKRR